MASRTTTDPIEILLEMGVDLDNLSEEEDYLSALMEAIATIEFKTKGKGDARSAALRQEVIKIRKGKRKPQARKTNISADSFKKGTATTSRVGQRALPPAIEPKTSIIPYQKPDEVDDEEEGGKKKKARTRKKTDKDQKLLEGIAKSVSNIADILKDQYGLKKKKASYDRKKAETEQRKLKESNLEKRFQGLASTAEKIIQPVRGILDRILDFFLKIIVGRFLVKLIGWFGDPKNKKKVDSVVRFLVDHGPKLLAAFLLFGTGIGRFAVRLSAVLLKGALRLGADAAKFALGFARRHPAAAAITAIVGGAAIAGALNKKDDAGSGGASPAPGSSPEPTVSGRFDMEAKQGYINNKPVSLEEYNSFRNMSSEEKVQTYGAPSMKEGGFVPNFFGMAKGAGSSIKEKGFGNAALDFAGGALGGVKNFMDEKGISDVLMAHPLAKLGLLGFDKGKELLGGLTDHLNETGLTDILMQHPLAKMGAFGLDKFMNFGKDPARDITGESGKDVTGAGVDTQLISARPGDFVVNKKTADAMGPDYFDAISTDTGEKVSGAGPDTQMIAVRPGEIVVNRETVSALGPDHFLGLNRLFGGAGANKPKMAKVQSASNGGFVLPAFSAGGYVSGTDTGKRGTPDPEKKESSGGPSGLSGPAKSSVVLALKDGVQGKLDKATGKFTPAEFTKAERARYTKFGGTIPEPKPKAKPQNRLLGTLTGAATGAAAGAMLGGPLGALIGGVAGGVLGSGILSGESDPNKPKRSSFPRGRSGAKKYSEAMKKYKAQKQQAAAQKEANKPKRSDFPMGRAGGKAYSEALKKHQSGDSTTAQPATPKATTKTLTKEQLLGKSGVMPTTDQLSATATKRHAELMKSTDQKRIADYDAKHGAGAYSKKLQEKLNKMYSPEKAKQMTTGKVKPTGKVVGRENLPRRAQEALARMDAQRNDGLQAGAPRKDSSYNISSTSTNGVMEYTRNGKKISAEEFNRIKSGNIIPGGGKPGGFLGGMMEGAKNMLGGMFKPGETKTIFKDGNIGTPTAEEQKAIDRLNAKKAKLRATETTKNITQNRSYEDMSPEERERNVSSYPPEMRQAVLEISKMKSQAKLSSNQPSPASPPGPPPGGGNNVKVVRAPSPGGGSNPNDKNTGGSDVDAAQTGNGNKAKWNILGIPMPF